MSEQPAQEPTMEEILASIRRIISEDEAPAGEAAAAEPEAEPAPAPEPEPVVAEAAEDEVLELTEKVETHGDIDAIAAPAVEAAAEPPAPPPAPAPAAVDVSPAEPLAPMAALVSASTATAAASAFSQLSANIGMPPEGLTLADTVRDLLRPLLKEWLDANLAGIVQTTVSAEVERIARGR
jgi:cell pole-organizing protein PopZ